MPMKHKQVSQLEKSFQKQTEILKGKLEEISPLQEAPYDSETGRPKAREVKTLRTHLIPILSNYNTVYTEIAEIFDKILTEMEDGDDRNEQEESAQELASTYTELSSKAQDGIGSLGVLLEEYNEFIEAKKEREDRERQDQKEREERERQDLREDRERQDQKEREENERRLRSQEMDMRHAEEMERLRMTERNRMTPASGDESRGEKATGIKLPKIQMKSFSGNLLEFREFWEMYEATVHLKAGLSAVEKFNLLKTYLKGDAEALVKGFSITSENYQMAVDMLKERYGRKEIVISSHMAQLQSLVAGLEARPSTNLQVLRNFYNAMESH